MVLPIIQPPERDAKHSRHRWNSLFLQVLIKAQGLQYSKILYYNLLKQNIQGRQWVAKTLLKTFTQCHCRRSWKKWGCEIRRGGMEKTAGVLKANTFCHWVLQHCRGSSLSLAGYVLTNQCYSKRTRSKAHLVLKLLRALSWQLTNEVRQQHTKQCSLHTAAFTKLDTIYMLWQVHNAVQRYHLTV